MRLTGRASFSNRTSVRQEVRSYLPTDTLRLKWVLLRRRPEALIRLFSKELTPEEIPTRAPLGTLEWLRVNLRVTLRDLLSV